MGTKESPINFGAGPGKIASEVLEEAQTEFLSYQNLGFSVTELSHRSKEYEKINKDAQSDVKELLSVPDNYKIIFLHGGGQGLFSAVAMNLMGRTGSADYAVTGIWSRVAAKEAEKYGAVNVVFPPPEKSGSIPDQKNWSLNPNAAYFYYCDNDTIEGVEFPFVPDTKGVPIVVDMSSNIMTKKIEVSKFGIIFAASQKNLGTAGVAVVILREDLLGNAIEMCPSILNFSLVANADSILNTPPIFPIYIVGKVLQWIKKHGGIEEMEKLCKKKSRLLYDTIRSSHDFYSSGIIDENLRSRINVPFRIRNGDTALEDMFLKEAEKRYMYQLKGHKLVGGIRVSLYNSISYEDVVKLVTFMKEFREHIQN